MVMRMHCLVNARAWPLTAGVLSELPCWADGSRMRLGGPGGCRSRRTVGLPRLAERRSRWIIGARRLRQERRLARQPFDDARQRFPALQRLAEVIIGDATHAGCGLAIGQNGVCVFEHEHSYFAPLLVHAAALDRFGPNRK